MNFTDLAVKRLRPAAKEVVVWDTNMPGFGLRVSPTGRKTFIVQYRVRGEKGQKWRERQETIGTLADLETLGNARAKARERRNKAREGTDPVVEKKAAEAAVRAEQAAQQLTFAKLAAQYQVQYADRETKASTAAETKRLLGRWLAVLGERPVNDIRKADIMAFLNARGDRGRTEGNALLGAVKHLFKWAKQRDLMDSNPAEDVAKPLARVPSRDRYLSDDEIKSFWAAADQVGWPSGKDTATTIAYRSPPERSRQAQMAGARLAKPHLEPAR